MSRTVALTVALFLGTAGIALAQTHPQTHPQGRPHDPATHPAMDPAQHAAMHAAVLGTWTGTSNSTGSGASKLDIVIAHDKLGNLTLKMQGDQSMRVGEATAVSIEAKGLQWTQMVAGAPCQATAVLSPASNQVPETINGTLACGQRDIAFTLHKAKG
jgi:hypothetical protein